MPDPFEVFQTDANPVFGSPPQDEEELKRLALRIVKDDVESGKRANDAMSGRRQELYQLYRAREDEKPGREGRSRIVSSDVMDVIEWMMPSFMRAFAGGRNCIEVNPQGTEDVEKAAKNEKLLNWQFMNRCRGFMVIYELVKAALVYGTSYAKITWREDFVRKGFSFPEVYEPEMEQLISDESVETITAGEVAEIPVGGNAMEYQWPPAQMEMVRVYRDVSGDRRIVTYSGPKVEVIPPEDLLIDPDAKSMDDAVFVIHRVRRTVSYLREREKEGVYSRIDEVVKHVSSDEELRTSEESSRFATAADESMSSGNGDDNDQVARRKVEVFEWWGRIDVKGDGITEPFLAVMAGDVIIRLERNPYAHGNPPFVEVRPMLDLFRFHGIGMAEVVGEFQRVKTALVRQTLDNLSYQNNQMWEVDENAGVDVDSLINPRPGGVVFTNVLGKGFRQITPQPLGQAPLHMMEFIQTQLEQRSGVTRYSQGLDARSLNKTASGIQAIMGASQQRIELIARILSDSIRRIYTMMLELNQQFIDQEVVIRVFNEPLPISPDDLAGNFDVQVEIGGATGKEEQEVEHLLGLLQHSTMLLQLGVQTPQNIYEVVKKIMEIWGWKDYSTLVRDPQETEQMRMILQQIGQLGQMVQMGQLPAPEQIMQVLQGTYQVLATIVGGGGGQGGHGQDNVSGQDGGGGPTVVGIRDAHAGQGGGARPTLAPGGPAELEQA